MSWLVKTSSIVLLKVRSGRGICVILQAKRIFEVLSRPIQIEQGSPLRRESPPSRKLQIAYREEPAEVLGTVQRSSWMEFNGRSCKKTILESDVFYCSCMLKELLHGQGPKLFRRDVLIVFLNTVDRRFLINFHPRRLDPRSFANWASGIWPIDT